MADFTEITAQVSTTWQNRARSPKKAYGLGRYGIGAYGQGFNSANLPNFTETAASTTPDFTEI